MTFRDRLIAAQTATGSLICVGLDPLPDRLPEPLRNLPDKVEAVRLFCKEIIAATADVACAYKPNLAFFEALGARGWEIFEDLVDTIPDDRIIIADAKRGDIGSTADLYAEAFFGRLLCDGITVSPYMGSDALTPFLQYPGTCTFALVLTSNPGAEDLQLKQIDGEPLYKHTARMAVAAAKDQPGEIGFVVGATRPALLGDLRTEFPDVPFLVPGVGTQGGSYEDVLKANKNGPILINLGRSVLYASSGNDFAEKARGRVEGRG